MTETEKFFGVYSSLEMTREYVAEKLLVDLTENIIVLAQEKNISVKALALAIGCDDQHVIDLINGGAELTLRELALIAWALNMEVQLVAD